MRQKVENCASHWKTSTHDMGGKKLLIFSLLPSLFLPCDLPPPPPPTRFSSSASSSSSFPSSFIPPSGDRSSSRPIWDTVRHRQGKTGRELLNHTCCWRIHSRYHLHISLSDMMVVTCLARAAPWPRGGGLRLRLMGSDYLKVNEGLKKWSQWKEGERLWTCR